MSGDDSARAADGPPGAGGAGRPGMADAISKYPWSSTPLGPPESWDPAVTAVVDTMLTSPIAMALAYGESHTLVYNDRYAAALGARHPRALGAPAREVFPELWGLPGFGDVFDRVYRTGEPSLQPDSRLPVSRGGPGGPVEQGWYTRAHAPVRDTAGRVVGVLAMAIDTSGAARRLETLSRLTTALAATSTLDDVAQVSLGLAFDALDADEAEFAVDDPRGWRVLGRTRRELAEDDSRLPPLWRRIPATGPEATGPEATGPGATGPGAGDAAGPTVLRAATGGEPLFPVTGSAPSIVALPLRGPSLRGAFALGYGSPRDWSPGERELLLAVAEVVAQAAERARLSEQQHGTAQLLQRSLLPQKLPSTPAYRVAARYEPGADGFTAGGDFYDAFELPDGRLAVALGDVAGHDVRAAAVMGQVRAGLRAAALAHPDPATALGALDRLVTNLADGPAGEELFVTVAYAVADPVATTLEVATAGHPAPLLRRAGDPARAEFVDAPPGPPLGLGGAYQAVTVKLGHGDTVVMFSDGVVERRGRDIGDGLAALAGAVATAVTGDPRGLCALTIRAVPGGTDDDVAVLALEYVARPSRVAGIDLAPDPTMPARARRWLARQLREWSVPEEAVDAAVLCVSELVTNALLHAGTTATVDLDLSEDRLMVAVSDSGTRGRATRSDPDALSTRGRGLNLVEGIADAWGSETTLRGSTVWFELFLTASPSGGRPGTACPTGRW